MPPVLPTVFLSSSLSRLAVAALVVFIVTIFISTIFEESEIRRKGRRSNTTILDDANYFSRRVGLTKLNRDGKGLLLRGYENVGLLIVGDKMVFVESQSLIATAVLSLVRWARHGHFGDRMIA
jgi:hypothetical protein